MAKKVVRAGRLEGRKILISGGASGIGLETSRLFIGEGAQVAMLDRDGDATARAAGAIKGIAVTADVTDQTAVQRAVAEAAHQMGGIDGVVTCAGITPKGGVASTDLALWNHVIGVNMTGTFLVVQAALPWLQQAAAATIVNISSGQALMPTPNQLAYAASKAGVLSLTKSFALELAPAIRANAICPGVVDTPMAAGSLGGMDAAAMTALLSRYALKRVATSTEIANAILFLTSEESSFVTGVTLAVDGGRTFH